MALHDVRTPDGQILKINAPDDASEEDILGFAQSQYKPMAGQKRSWGEAATDIGAGLASGVGALAQIPGQLGQLAGITSPEEADTGLQGVGKSIEKFGEELKSPVLKYKEQQRAQKVAEASAPEGIEGMWGGFKTAIGQTIKDPALLTNFFAEQVPNLIGSWGGGMVARGATKALMSDAIKTSLGEAGAARVIGKAGTAGAVGTGAVMQGADIGSDTYEEVYKRLKKESPDMSDEERTGIALAKGREAGINATLISLGTAFLPGGTSVERALAGKGMPGAGGMLKGFLGEAGSEAIEEGGGKAVSNLAQQSLFPDVALTRGVGEAAGMGALGGGLFGGISGGVNASRDARMQELQAAIEAAKAQGQDTSKLEQEVLLLTDQGVFKPVVFPDGTVAMTREEVAQYEQDQLNKQYAAQPSYLAALPSGQQIDLFHGETPPQPTQQQPTLGQALAGPQAPVQEAQAPTQQQLELGLPDQGQQLGLPGMGTPYQQPTPQAEVAQPETMLVSSDLLRAMGVAGGNKKVRNLVEGKDLADPAQRIEVRDALIDFAERTTSPGTADKIDQFLKLPFFMEQGELKLPKRRVSAKQRTAQLQAAFGNKLAQAQGAPVSPQELPHEREQKLFADQLQAAFGNKLRAAQAQQKPVPQPTEATNVEPAGVPGGVTAQPTTQRRADQPSMAVDQLGNRPTTTQEGAPTGTEGVGSRGLADITGGTQPNVRGAQAAPAPVNPFASLVSQVPEAKPKKSKKAKEESVTTKGKVLNAFEAPATVDTGPTSREKLLDGDLPKAVREGAVGIATPALTAAAQKKTVTHALSEIANGKQFNPLAQLVAKRLLKNKRYSLPKIEIVPAGSLGVASGQYDPKTDTIQIEEGAVDSHTVLHEAIHGFVHAMIVEFEAGNITSKPLTDLKNLYDHLVANHPELAEAYGMESLTEFAAEAMSNPDFQAALNRIPYKSRNVFQEFARAVMEMLGLTGGRNTALGEALINVEGALNTGRGFQENVSGTSTAPVANVNKAQLNALNAAAGITQPKKAAVPVFTQMANNAKALNKDMFSNVWDKIDTMVFSFDAGLNNAIMRQMKKDKSTWAAIKDAAYKMYSGQALHSDAISAGFLEHGAVAYDPKTYTWSVTDAQNSYKNMISEMARVAKANGLTFEELKTYANTAFIADRMEGLAKSNPDFYSHMNPAQIAAGKQLFNAVPELRDIQKVWNGIRENAMNAAVEGGLYSRKQADDLLKYHDFVPFYREDQLEHRAGPKEYSNGFVDFAKNFKIKGSDQPVADVFGNMEMWTTYTVSRAVRNKSAINKYELAKQVMPSMVEDMRQDERAKKEENATSIWINGQRQKVKFADPMWVHAFEGMEPISLPMMSKAADFLRKSIVLNPLFSVSQLTQDSFSAMITAGLKNPLMIPFEVMKEFTNTLFGSQTAAAKYLKARGAVGTRDYGVGVARKDFDIATGQIKPTLKQKLLAPLERLSMASDNAVRQALFNRTLLETGGKRQKDGSIAGGDYEAAMHKAFEIINFKRSGASGGLQILKQQVPFFGAYLQAMNVTAKVLMGKSISPTERKAAYASLLWNTAVVSALAFSYAAMVGGDDDYEKMDPQIRDKHLLIPGTGIMLPLRNDFTLFPKLAAEYGYLMLTDNGFTDGKKIRKAMGEAVANAVLSPTVVPQVLKPAFEVGINHNFFTGREVVGKGIAGKDVEYRYTDSTSELGKLLGQTGMIAPVNADHLIRGYLGSVGGLLLLGTNAVMQDSGVPKAEKGDRDVLRQIPGMGTFFASEHGNAMKNDFYDLRAEVTQAVTTLNDLKKNEPSKAAAYMEEHKDVLKLQGQVNAINNQLSKLRTYTKQIQSLPEERMNASEKKVMLDRLRENEDRMLMNVYKLRNMAGY